LLHPHLLLLEAQGDRLSLCLLLLLLLLELRPVLLLLLLLLLAGPLVQAGCHGAQESFQL
jgi:hypothetical protein